MKDKMFFETLGVDVRGLTTLEDVLEKAELNYEVTSENIYLKDFIQIPDKFANVRRDIDKILGIVGKNYKIVQNRDGFKFIDDLIKNGFKFISAGSYNDFSGAFIILYKDSMNIFDEEFDMMLLVTNCFDGSGTIKVEFTPIRKSCGSALVIVDKNIDTKISIKHCSQSKDGLSEINKILNAYDKYKKYFKKLIETLTQKNIPHISEFVEDLIQIDKNDSNIISARKKAIQEGVVKLYLQSEKRGDNALKLLLSVANYESHRLPIRDTGNSQVYLDRVMSGMPFTNDVLKYIRRKFLW